MSSLGDFYKEELLLFKESAKTFSNSHPAITENLIKETMDPDADMLLKGLAYLSAQLRHEASEQFPEALQSISQLVAPHLMHPIPAMTMLAFTPKPNLLQPYSIAAGKSFDTSPVGQSDAGEDIKCRFNNAWSVEVLPVTLKEITITSKSDNNTVAERSAVLSLSFSSERSALNTYHFSKLRLYFNQSHSDSCKWMSILHSRVNRLCVTDEHGQTNLAANVISFPAMQHSYANASEPNKGALQQLLTDYFLFPEKFLFVDIDLSMWSKRGGSRFSIDIDFTLPNFPLPDLVSSNVHLYTSPAINKFEQYAEPIRLTAFNSQLQITVQNRQLSQNIPLDVCHIDSVEGIISQQDKTIFLNDALQPQINNESELSYTFFRKPYIDKSVSLSYLGIHRQSAFSNIELLRVKVHCNQEYWASKVNVNQLTQPTSSSPELVSFTNITPATDYQPASLVTESAWQIVSDQNISLNMLQSSEQLKQLLLHHIPETLKTTAKQKANLHRINSIANVNVNWSEKTLNGRVIRGMQYDVSINEENFNSAGELFLFSALLNQILKMKSPINSFVQLNIINARSADVLPWPVSYSSDLV